jgi:hypothetical protein
MDETSFFVRPLDVAFFGPPEAQSAGDTHYSRSLFPLPPRAFQGLVRSRLLTAGKLQHSLSDRSKQARQERERLVGGSDTLPAGWQITGPLPISRVERGEEEQGAVFMPWVPAPTFLVRPSAKVQRSGALQRSEEQEPPLRVRRIELHPRDHATGGVAGRKRTWQVVLGTPGFTAGEPLDGWIDARNLFWALSGEGSWSPQGFRHSPPIVRRELRVGLALEAGTRQAKDRMLYAVDQLRFDGVGGFVGTLRVSGGLPAALSPEALTTGTAPLGRWHRLAALEPAPPLVTEWLRIERGEHLPERAEDGWYWLIAITPFCSETKAREGSAGGEPSVLAPTLHSVSCAEQIEFWGALLGKAVVLGGFSLSDNKARPNRTYVPAGSAWVFKIPGVAPERRAEMLRELNGAHCLGPLEEARMGFGRVLVGRALDE